jgi:hypothetical protein
LNRAGLDESTSISSRAFELFSEGKNPLQVTITLNLKAEEAIRYHYEYFMLLGCTEFTKVYLKIKDNPWPYVNLANQALNLGIADVEVIELLKIAKGYLPRARLEYDRLNEEINSRKAESNSWKAELNNTVRIYQGFCDRNLTLRKREDELKQSISRLDAKEAELQTRLNKSLSEFQENDADNNNPNLERTPDRLFSGEDNNRIIDTGELSANITLDDITDKLQEKGSRSSIRPRNEFFES